MPAHTLLAVAFAGAVDSALSGCIAVPACCQWSSLPAPAHRHPPPLLAEKHGNENKNRPTEIICKFFLEAVEKVGLGYVHKVCVKRRRRRRPGGAG